MVALPTRTYEQRNKNCILRSFVIHHFVAKTHPRAVHMNSVNLIKRARKRNPFDCWINKRWDEANIVAMLRNAEYLYLIRFCVRTFWYAKQTCGVELYFACDMRRIAYSFYEVTESDVFYQSTMQIAPNNIFSHISTWIGFVDKSDFRVAKDQNMRAFSYVFITLSYLALPGDTQNHRNT